MANVIIVTDSTADIPDELVEKHGIYVIRLNLMFGDESYMDGVDMTAKQFYDRLVQSSQLPTTSQPSPAKYVDVYEQVLKEHPGSPIVSIHISSGLSGTYQSALLAKSMMEEKGADITVIDSRSASYGYGLFVVHAARMAEEGRSVSEIVDAIERLKQERKLYFLVDTLEYLQKGGRIGKAAAMIGNLLNIKPILSIDEEGIIYAVEKVRGQKKAMARLIERFQDDLKGVQNINVGLGHTANEASVEPILQQLSQLYNINEVVYTNIGPVVGSHVGPGTIAVFIWPA